MLQNQDTSHATKSGYFTCTFNKKDNELTRFLLFRDPKNNATQKITTEVINCGSHHLRALNGIKILITPNYEFRNSSSK